MKNNRICYTLCLIIGSFLLMSCTSEPKNDEIIKKKPNPNLIERAKENAEKNPLFDLSKNKSSGNFEFSNSNVLWRATLNVLNFIPLNNTDYSGGVIITDWYGNSKEQIKISVKFLSNELSSTSVQVTAHKKICDQNSNCSITPANTAFNSEIKEKIINEARVIKIKDEKNKK